MSREAEILKYVDPKKLGIEVAPYFNPLLPKANGNKVLILDVFGDDELRQYAEKDANIPNSRIGEIESVDLVGDASKIGEVVSAQGYEGKIHHIVSSHNFEHLPNPIRFLQGCEQVLVEGGILSMAIPDYRTCFDHFRMPSRLADWLRAFHENDDIPSVESHFDGGYVRSEVEVAGLFYGSIVFENANTDLFRTNADFKASYNTYKERKSKPLTYVDTHVSVMFGEIFEHFVRDLNELGLVDLELQEVSATRSHEFYVHLRKNTGESDAKGYTYEGQRDALLRKIALNLGGCGFPCASLSQADITGTNEASQMRSIPLDKQRFVPMKGDGLFKRIRKWNRRRRHARHFIQQQFFDL